MSHAAAADLLVQMRDDAMSITDCFDASGYINTDRFLHTIMEDDEDDLLNMLDDDTNALDEDRNPREKKRRKKRVILARRNVDGILEEGVDEEGIDEEGVDVDGDP